MAVGLIRREVSGYSLTMTRTAFQQGTSASDFYRGEYLAAKENIVVVTLK